MHVIENGVDPNQTGPKSSMIKFYTFAIHPAFSATPSGSKKYVQVSV